jgi:hypothetical protein
MRPLFENPGRPAQARRRILLVSYHFPPDSTIGARRWEKLAPFVAERGWGLDIIMCAPSTACDVRRLERLPAGVRLYGVPPVALRIEKFEHLAGRAYRTLRNVGTRAADDRRRNTAGAGRHPQVPSGRRNWLEPSEIRWDLHTARGLLRAYWALIQYRKHRLWARRAASLALRVVDQKVHIAVVTSAPPHLTHDSGREVSRRTGLPFVMDMRDPWSLSVRIHESVASPLWLCIARRYEQLAVAQASLIVANTETAHEAFAAAYPSAVERLITVMNGSDPDLMPPSSLGRRFTIAYAGTIYLEREPRNLFRAAARVIQALQLTPSDFGIDFIGADTPDSVLEIARNEGVADFVSAQPTRPYREALDFLARATMLVVFDADAITIPAKIFECVRFDAWLLVLSDPDSATHRLLRGSQADVLQPDRVGDIAAVIRRRYEDYRRGVRPTRAVGDDRFSRRRQAGILLDRIARLLPSDTDPSAGCLPATASEI